MAAEIEQDEDYEVIPIEIAQEYMAKVLGFAPLQLSDDIYNIVLDHLGQMIDNFVEKIVAKFGSKLSSERVDKLCNILKYKLEGQQNNLFDIFDKFLVGDLLYLDQNVVLDDDAVHLKYSDRYHKSVETRLDTLRNRINVLNLCQSLIRQEMSELAVHSQSLQLLRQRLNHVLDDTYSVKSVDELCLALRKCNASKTDPARST